MNRSDLQALESSPLARQAATLVAVIVVVVVGSVWLIQRSMMSTAQAATIDPQRAGHGQDLFVQTCASCHGKSAQGLPHQGADLRHSTFVSKQPDAALLKFLRTGRTPDDKQTVLGLPMPPRGGNASLSDDNLADIVAFLRQVQRETPGASPATTQPTYSTLSRAAATVMPGD